MTDALDPAPGAPRGEHDSDSRERAVQRAGRDLVFSLYATVRSLRLYPLENQATQNALTELESAAKRLLAEEDEISLRYVGELCFVNDLRLRVDLGNYATIGGVGRMLRRHGIGEVVVLHAATRAEWVAFLSSLAQDPDLLDPFERFVERLDRSRVAGLFVRHAAEHESQRQESEGASEAARRTYAYSVAVAREVISGARLGRSVGLRRAKRAVQSIVDQVLNNETSIVGMTALRNYDEYTFAHSVNVCILGVALGKRIGLAKSELYELGLGGLLHDIGKVRMPIEVVNKTSSLNDDEWVMIREHPAEGLLTLLEMQDLSYLPLRAVLMAYEHHMKLDLSGYPTSYRPRRSHLFARIVAIADAFDAATSRRSYQTQPIPADKVLREMRDSPERGHDPVLTRAFMSVVGVYPVGSVVALDNHEVAVVVAANPLPEHAHQPTVRLAFDDLGQPVEPPLLLDLSEPDPRSAGGYRSIVKTLDSETYGIDTDRYLV